MNFLLNENQITNKIRDMKNETSDMVYNLYNVFTEAADGFGSDEVYSEGPLFDFINRRTSRINIMKKPFYIMSEIYHTGDMPGAAAYMDELAYLCNTTDTNIFSGYISDHIRYILLHLINVVVKRIAYEFDWIDENYIYESFRAKSNDMYHWSFNLINSRMIELLNRAHHECCGEDDPNYENNVLMMAGPMIEYLSTSITVVVADIIFHVLYNMFFAVADGETYIIACETLSEIIIAFKNDISKMISAVIIETVHHRGQVNMKYEETLKTAKLELREYKEKEEKQYL